MSVFELGCKGAVGAPRKRGSSVRVADSNVIEVSLTILSAAGIIAADKSGTQMLLTALVDTSTGKPLKKARSQNWVVKKTLNPVWTETR